MMYRDEEIELTARRFLETTWASDRPKIRFETFLVYWLTRRRYEFSYLMSHPAVAITERQFRRTIRQAGRRRPTRITARELRRAMRQIAAQPITHGRRKEVRRRKPRLLH